MAIMTMSKQALRPKVADRSVKLQKQHDVTAQTSILLPFAVPWTVALAVG